MHIHHFPCYFCCKITVNRCSRHCHKMYSPDLTRSVHVFLPTPCLPPSPALSLSATCKSLFALVQFFSSPHEMHRLFDFIQIAMKLVGYAVQYRSHGTECSPHHSFSGPVKGETLLLLEFCTPTSALVHTHEASLLHTASVWQEKCALI